MQAGVTDVVHVGGRLGAADPVRKPGALVAVASQDAAADVGPVARERDSAGRAVPVRHCSALAFAAMLHPWSDAESTPVQITAKPLYYSWADVLAEVGDAAIEIAGHAPFDEGGSGTLSPIPH